MIRTVMCNPPMTCFSCSYPDCVNGTPVGKPEFDFGSAAINKTWKAKRWTAERRIKELEKMRARNKERVKYRREHGLCTKCGDPLTAEAGEHHICQRRRLHCAEQTRNERKRKRALQAAGPDEKRRLESIDRIIISQRKI